MKKTHYLGLRWKLFGLSFAIVAILFSISLPISSVVFHHNEINIQKNQIRETMESLSSVFNEGKIGSLVELDYSIFNEVYENKELVPGTDYCKEYLEKFSAKEKEKRPPLGMTEDGNFRQVLKAQLQSLVIPTKSKYLYFGVYNPLTNLFLVSCGCFYVPKEGGSLVDEQVVQSGYYFHNPYDFNHTNLGIEYQDQYKGNLFVNAIEVNYIESDSSIEANEYWIVCEMDMVYISEAIWQNNLSYFIISLLSTLLIFSVLVVLSNFIFGTRIKKLSLQTGDFTEGMRNDHFQTTVSPHDKKLYDEIDSLNNDIYYLESELNTYVCNLKKAITKEEKIKSELELSNKIQLASLPNEKIIDKKIAIAPLILPAREVGGDLYDYFYINDNKFAFLIGDVSGKGVPAALFMMKAKTLIKQALMIEGPLEESVNAINKELANGNDNNLFITAIIMVVNINTGELEYINCGHEEFFLQRGDQFEKVEHSSNIPLGIVSDFSFHHEITTLENGNVIYLYTDGVSEAQNSESKLFGKEKILSFLNKFSYLPSLCLNQSMLNVVLNYEQGHEQDDDICMLTFTYHPNFCHIINEVGEMEEVVDYVNQSIQDIKDEVAKANFQVIVDEIVSNVVYYAYGEGKGDIFVTVKKEEGSMLLQVTDYGVEFNPFENEVIKDENRIGGLGILLTKTLATSYSYERKNGVNIVTVTLNYEK